MPYKISSREVLRCLNHLGYTNIDAQQLKQFMLDLKKLIKYEQQKQKDENQNISVRDTVEDIFTSLYQHSTVESRAKQTPPKNKVVSVEIRKKPKEHRAHCIHHGPNKENVDKQTDRLSGIASQQLENPTKSGISLVDKDTQTDLNDIARQVGSSKSGVTKKKTIKKPTSQVIRTTSCTSSKSDPVALYHQYQEEWKKIKIPGQDNRADLRWAIREKMMSGRKC